MKNAAKESDVQRSPRSTREGAALWCLIWIAMVLCNPESPGAPQLVLHRGAVNQRQQSAVPVATLTSSWSTDAHRRESMTVLAHIWYLSCTSRYYQNPSHDQQTQLCCSSPFSIQGAGEAAHSLASGLRLRFCWGWVKTSALYREDWDWSWKCREETSVQVTPACGGRPRQGRYPILPAGSAQASKWFSFPPALPKTFNSIF